MKRINYKKANLDKSLFKTYIETGESTGEYSLADSLVFPTTGYKFNAERSSSN